MSVFHLGLQKASEDPGAGGGIQFPSPPCAISLTLTDFIHYMIMLKKKEQGCLQSSRLLVELSYRQGMEVDPDGVCQNAQ